MNNKIIDDLCIQLKLFAYSASNQQQIPVNVVFQVQEKISNVIQQISDKNVSLSQRLNDLKNNLFIEMPYGGLFINQITYGQIIEFLEFVKWMFFTKNQEKDGKLCSLLHPDILRVSEKLYRDGSYAEAVCNAFIEINFRLKKLYCETYPNVENVPDGQSLMNKVFADNDPLFYVGDRTTQTGKDIQSGTRFLFAGAMAAFRNPKSHENIQIEKADSMRRLIFASMLMFKIDELIKKVNADCKVNE